MAEVRLERVRKQFGHTTAVRDVNLVVKGKEFFSLLGPSGCGKTTLLNMIAGLIDVTSGEIYIDGREMSRVAPKDRGVAMVFQDYALYPHMTVYENLAFPLKAQKLPRRAIEEKIEYAAASLEISHLIDRLPRELSGGQRQRVALGRALVRNPKVFLMDEPLSNLDARLRVQMRTELKQLHKRLEATVIYVTHDQAEAMTLSDRIAVLAEGVVQQVGPPKEIYDRPANRFVANFLGLVAMNQISGQLSCRHEGPYFVDGDFAYPLPNQCRSVISGLTDGAALCLGIHAEHVLVRRESSAGAIAARVELVEQAGSDQYLVLRLQNATIVSRVSPDAEFNLGETVFVVLPAERVYCFDGATGETIV